MSRVISEPRPGLLPRRSSTYSSSRPDRSPYALWALGAILLAMSLQILFLLVGCDWDFSGDEAEYWAWSRRLDLSYYAKGPLIAWLIRLSTELFGGLSQNLVGSHMFAARLPAVLLGGLTGWGVFQLAVLTTAQRRAGLLAMLLLPAIPALAIGGVLITPDTPLICCWTWAAVWALRAVMSDNIWAWLLAGLIGALGVLAKYTALAFPFATGLFLLLCPRYRRQLVRPGFWAMALLCFGLGLGPILVWNVQHNWVALAQMSERLGFTPHSTWGRIAPVLKFFGGDVLALGLLWWLAGVAAIWGAFRRAIRAIGRRKSNETEPVEHGTLGVDAGSLFLLCLWGVIWTACLVDSLLGEYELNWLVPGYIPLVVLIGVRAASALSRRGAKARFYVSAWCISIAGVVAIHHTDWFYPAMARWVPAPTKRWPAPLRIYDPTARLRGHKALAREVEKRLDVLRAGGASPFVLTATYALASTLSFHLSGQSETYCLSWNFGMTPQPVNQHDLWHPNPRHDPEFFQGRPFLVVDDANMPPSSAQHNLEKGVFGARDSVERVVVRERGLVVGVWDISLCRDYHGIAGYKQDPWPE